MPLSPDELPDYIDPAMRDEVARRMQAAAEQTVVEPLLSFDNALIPPAPLASDFDLGARFMAVRLYEMAVLLDRTVDQSRLPSGVSSNDLRGRALLALLFTLAEGAEDFRENTVANPDRILEDIVTFVAEQTLERVLDENRQIGGAP